MALSPKCLSLLFFLTLSSSLPHIHARDSQFFNKFTTTPTTTDTPTTTTTTVPTTTNTNKMPNDQFVPDKEQPLNKEEEQDPNNFTPQTQNGGYGLYGHESGQLPPSTTNTATENLPEFQEDPLDNNNNNNNYYFYKNNEAYETTSKPEGMSDTRFMQNKYTTTPTGNNQYTGGDNYNAQLANRGGYTTTGNNQYYNGGDNYNTQLMDRGGYTTNPTGYNRYSGGDTYNSQFVTRGAYTTTPTGNNRYSGGGDNYNTQLTNRGYTTTRGGGGDGYYNNVGNNYGTEERKGMSDTRYLENGKYYYDLNSENNYGHGYQNLRGVNNYNTKGYYGNNENNNMNEYPNQEEFFEESQEERFMP